MHPVKLIPLLLPLCFSWQAHAHGIATYSQLEQDHIQAAASFSYRNHDAIDDQQYFYIPGIMMGGEAVEQSNGAVLDDAFVFGRYNFYQGYTANVKIAAHGGGDHSELEFEHFWLEKRLGEKEQLNTLIAVGKMSGNFTPSASWHSSTSTFSEAPLNADVFFGRYYNETGVSAAINQGSFSLGLNVFNGDAFPANSGEGSYTLFSKYQSQTKHWELSTGVWAMQSKANLRADDRYTSGHSHGNTLVSATPLDIRFTGDNILFGAHFYSKYNISNAWNVSFYIEAIQQQSEGVVDVVDNGRSADVELQTFGWQVEPAIAFHTHRLSIRYEQLTTENTITASAASFVASDAQLNSSGLEPERLSVSYQWQFNPRLSLRTEYIIDDASPQSHNRAMLGLVWQAQLWQRD